ncbi:MAG: hypothetical protein BYD32DRAFT_406280 [Podila humilis]|nr:MAG: hypothetical protein BYD32DRAFT_406280 [Podila humilis]
MGQEVACETQILSHSDPLTNASRRLELEFQHLSQESVSVKEPSTSLSLLINLASPVCWPRTNLRDLGASTDFKGKRHVRYLDIRHKIGHRAMVEKHRSFCTLILLCCLGWGFFSLLAPLAQHAQHAQFSRSYIAHGADRPAGREHDVESKFTMELYRRHRHLHCFRMIGLNSYVKISRFGEVSRKSQSNLASFFIVSLPV